MNARRKKLFIMVTNGPENPELSTIPFVMATAAQASDVEVVVGLQGNGAMLAMKCMNERIVAQGFPALGQLMEAYREAGGELHVCGPCSGARKIEKTDLMENAPIVGGATFVSESLEADQALIY